MKDSSFNRLETDEELLTEKQKRIIDSLVSKLYKDDSSLYYAPTIEIARLIKERIDQSGYLPRQEYLLVEKLRPIDIQNLLGYASSCC